MQVSLTTQNNYKYGGYNKQGLRTAPSFEGKRIANTLSYVVPLPFMKLKNYTPEEYSKLNTVDKTILRALYSCLIPPYNKDFYKNTEIIHEHVTDFIKNDFDKKYGENNYVVISIGRSLSSITKVLGYKIGEENVKNIPMSNAPRFQYINAVENLSEDSISEFKKYLSSIGLSKEDVQKSKKHFILTDFCATGQSLNGARLLFESDRMYGNLSNFHHQDVSWSIPHSLWDFRLSLRDYFLNSKFKRYSFVQKCDRLENTEASVFNTKKAPGDAKLVWFKMLDNFMRRKKTNISDLKKEYFY